MLSRIWPLLLRVAVGLYFIYPNINKLIDQSGTIKASIFSCIDQYIPSAAAYLIYYGFFVLIGVLVIALIRSVFPLVLALCVLTVQLFIDFSGHSYSPTTLLEFILLLVTLSLVLYTTNPQRR